MKELNVATRLTDDAPARTVRTAALGGARPPRLYHFVCSECGHAVRWKSWIKVLYCLRCDIRMKLRCIPCPPVASQEPPQKR